MLRSYQNFKQIEKLFKHLISPSHKALQHAQIDCNFFSLTVALQGGRRIKFMQVGWKVFCKTALDLFEILSKFLVEVLVNMVCSERDTDGYRSQILT